jgi:hypothetical protein
VESTDALILLIALASTWAMTGLIWTIQIVHYPIFDTIEHGVDNQLWLRFAQRHTSTISYVVGPFMVAEGVTGIWIAASPPAGISRALPLVALALMGVAYGVTALVSAPLHGRLAPRFDSALHTRLVRTNWARTAAWTLRAIVLCVIAYIAVT